MKPHKHAELIKAWADGVEIEQRYEGDWELTDNPDWDDDGLDFRAKHIVVLYGGINSHGEVIEGGAFGKANNHSKNNLKLTFDGETLKSAEVLK